jgi:nitrate reductase NapAB chaperone NapD
MLIAGSIISCIPGSTSEVAEFLKDYHQIEIHAIDDKKSNIVVTIEEETDAKLEDLCKKLHEYPLIIHISHHYFNFEDEIEKIGQGLPVDLTLKGFSKSEQRKERNKLNEY